MTVIKIVFVVLLLVPVAILMRYLLVRLSAETPAQTDPDVPVAQAGSRIRRSSESRDAGKGRSKGKPNPMGRFRKKPAQAKATAATDDRAAPEKKGSASTYTPRQPEQWQRSERVPFGESEGYHVDPPRKYSAGGSGAAQRQRPSDAARQRHIEETGEAQPAAEEKPAKKNRHRSEKSPSKRQLRKNRERARKRDMNKRKRERDI